MEHVPVLAAEVLEGLQIRPGVRAIDCTLGGGGHTAMILQRSAPDGKVLGLDADPAAISRVARRLSDALASGRLQIVQAFFDRLQEIAEARDFYPVDAILLDLGLSSFQLETPDRGFSLQHSGPLDMRYDPNAAVSAADIVNTWSERDLADLIFEFGEERHSRRIARYLVQNRPFHTTEELADFIEKAVGGRRGARIHPATRTFQALRIAVNQELTRLEVVLPQCLPILTAGGRIGVISFHSLEDRIVKRWLQQEARDYVQDRTHPLGGYVTEPSLRIVTPKPITPTPEEIQNNPRSRSAKLRIAERLG